MMRGVMVEALRGSASQWVALILVLSQCLTLNLIMGFL